MEVDVGRTAHLVLQKTPDDLYVNIYRFVLAILNPYLNAGTFINGHWSLLILFLII